MASQWSGKAAGLQWLVLAGLFGVIGFARVASAGSFKLWGIEGEYKATLGYSGAMRMENPDQALINGPVIPLEPQVLPPGQVVGFINPGLPSTINGDDGNRNFEKGDLVNNRLSLFTELQLRRENYGLVLSGDIFSDASSVTRAASAASC